MVPYFTPRHLPGGLATVPAHSPTDRATRIELTSFSTIQMRTFHLTWFAFFLAFFGWFGIAPLMTEVRDDLGLTKAQIGNTVIASVLVTIVARLAVGRLVERYGPRRTYAWLLVIGALPVMSIGLAQNYETFVVFRLLIGAVGASFVVTQYHTSLMFAPNVVGTANATTAGWGNLGGGIAQMAMPLVLILLVSLGLSEAMGWRVAMIMPGAAMILAGLAYYRFTRDTPAGDFRELPDEMRPGRRSGGTFLLACRDTRVWALFVLYGACFGIELTLNNVAALYFHDRFGLTTAVAGVVAGLFGLMNIFARTLGGFFGDRFGIRYGLKGRVWFLGATILAEGLALVAFSQVSVLLLAIPVLIIFSTFVQMAEGATFAVVPFVNPRAVGSVAGVVGAGGNAGAVLAGFLFRTSMPMGTAFLVLGIAVVIASVAVVAIRFSSEVEAAAQRDVATAVSASRSASRPALARVPHEPERTPVVGEANS